MPDQYDPDERFSLDEEPEEVLRTTLGVPGEDAGTRKRRNPRPRLPDVDAPSRHTWASSLVAAGVAVIAGFLVLLQTTQPSTATHVGEIVLSTILLALILALIVLVTGMVRDHPRLVIGDPAIHPRRIEAPPSGSRSVTTTTAWDIHTTAASVPAIGGGTADAHFAYLHVWNEPKHGSQTAQGVHLELRYLTEDGQELRKCRARWSDLPQTESLVHTGPSPAGYGG